MSVDVLKLNAADADFQEALEDICSWQEGSDIEVLPVVQGIINDVRAGGDKTLLALTQKFDQNPAASINDLVISQARCQQALAELPAEQREALQFAEKRLREYAVHQKISGWEFQDEFGSTFGQQVTALDRVGIYVPGGKAAYPSSVLMNAVPAKVAGVQEIIMVTPTPNGEINPLLLAAAAVAGVDKVITVGGAQAIAALAYGTETVPPVDKIVGPGNIWVATAKRLVFGKVGIDMIAGPSEVLIISDGSGNPDWIAMDMFAQAEHDEQAQALVLCTDAGFVEKIQNSIDKLLPTMERKTIIEQSLKNRGAIILVEGLQQAADISNQLAPEHLELALDNPDEIMPLLQHAGAIFVGHHTAEALGDYCAGPNHVLPTSQTARFSSPLGVYDFQKRSSILSCTEQGAKPVAQRASILARGEGLEAHARSAEYRK